MVGKDFTDMRTSKTMQNLTSFVMVKYKNVDLQGYRLISNTMFTNTRLQIYVNNGDNWLVQFNIICYGKIQKCRITRLQITAI